MTHQWKASRQLSPSHLTLLQRAVALTWFTCVPPSELLHTWTAAQDDLPWLWHLNVFHWMCPSDAGSQHGEDHFHLHLGHQPSVISPGVPWEPRFTSVCGTLSQVLLKLCLAHFLAFSPLLRFCSLLEVPWETPFLLKSAKVATSASSLQPVFGDLNLYRKLSLCILPRNGRKIPSVA